MALEEHALWPVQSELTAGRHVEGSTNTVGVPALKTDRKKGESRNGEC